MTTGNLEARVVADTSGFQAGMVQAAVVTEAQMRRIASYVKAANDRTAQLGATAQAQSASVTRAYDQVTAATERMAHGHAGVTRELLVLAHELSQGNFSRFGGSMLVLAERTNAVQFAMTGVGAATLGFGAAMVGAIALIAKGAIESSKFADSLTLTANAAGVTADSLSDMARALASKGTTTAGAARGALEGLVGSGRFGPEVLQQAAQAVVTLQRLSGQSAEDVQKDFERMSDGVAKWAAEHNRSFHFITAQQYEYIRTLENQGRTEDAEKAVLSALNSQLQSSAGWWDKLNDAVSGYIDKIEQIGRADTVGQQMEKLQARIESLNRSIASQGKPGYIQSGADSLLTQELTKDEAALARLRESQALANRVAADQAQHAAVQQRGVEAQKYLDQLHDELRTRQSLDEKLKEYQRHVAELGAAGVKVSAQQQASDEAAMRKKFAPTQDSKIYLGLTNTPEQIFRQAEAEQVGAVEKAFRESQIRDYEKIHELLERIRDLDTPQQEFRRQELDSEQQVTKAMQEQLLVQEQIAHETAQRSSYQVGVSKAYDDLKNHASDAAGFSEQVFKDAVGGMSDALTKFATTGKLSFKGLADSIIADLIRIQIEKGIVSLFGSGGALGAIGSFLGVGSAPTIPGHANGLDYVPYDGYLTYLHEGERVQTKQDAAVDRTRGAMHVDASVQIGSVGQGVSRAEVNAAVTQAQAQTVANIRRALKNGSMVTA